MPYCTKDIVGYTDYSFIIQSTNIGETESKEFANIDNKIRTIMGEDTTTC